VLSEAALRPARWRASSCRPKLGGALKTSHPPPRPRPNAAPCWPIRRRSWSREHRASCGERMGDPSGPRALVSASSAALYEVDKTRKRDVQTGGPTGAVESDAHAGTFLPEVREFITISRGRLPLTVVNWGSITLLLEARGPFLCLHVFVVQRRKYFAKARHDHDRMAYEWCFGGAARGAAGQAPPLSPGVPPPPQAVGPGVGGWTFRRLMCS
jgi:hypothetical protein